MLVPGSASLGPPSKHYNVTTTDVECVTKPMLRWSSTHSQTGPDEGISVQHTNVIQVAFLEGSALVIASSLLHVLLAILEASMHNQVGANKNGAMSLSWGWCWA